MVAVTKAMAPVSYAWIIIPSKKIAAFPSYLYQRSLCFSLVRPGLGSEMLMLTSSNMITGDTLCLWRWSGDLKKSFNPGISFFPFLVGSSKSSAPRTGTASPIILASPFGERAFHSERRFRKLGRFRWADSPWHNQSMYSYTTREKACVRPPK